MIKRIFVILTLALCVSAAAHAQYDRNIVQRLTKVDYNRWHFGFILGLGFNDYRTVPNNYVDEDKLDEKGKPNYEKLRPVLFEMPTYKYLRTGDIIGDCMRMGKAYGTKVINKK